MSGSHHLTYLAGRALPALIGFFAIIAYSHVFDPAIYGEFAVAMGGANIAMASLMMWVRATMMRYAATGDAKGERMIGVGLAMQAGLTLLLVATLFLLAMVLSSTVLALVALLAAAIGWSDLNLDLLRARHQARRYGAQYFLRQVLTVVMVAAAFASGAEWNPIALGFIAGNLISSTLLIGQIVPRKSFAFGRDDLGEFLRYGLPLSLNYCLSSLTYTLDRLIVNWFLGKEAAGIYSLAADLVIQILGVVMDGITLAFLPQAARALDREGKAAASGVLRSNLLVLLGLAMPAALGLAVCGPSLGVAFLGTEFGAGATIIIPLLAVAVLFRGVRVFYIENVLQLHHRASSAVVATAISAGVLGGLALVLVPVWGIEGAAVAAVVSTFLATGYGLASAKPLLVGGYPITDVAKIGLASLVSGGSALLCLTVSSSILGISLAIAMGVVAYAATIWLVNPAGARGHLMTYVGARRAP